MIHNTQREKAFQARRATWVNTEKIEIEMKDRELM